jgi:hypothetical protein
MFERKMAVKSRPVLLSLSLLLLAATAHAQNKRDIAVREDKQELAEDESWFYDDLETAIDAAAKTQRPLMVVFR